MGMGLRRYELHATNAPRELELQLREWDYSQHVAGVLRMGLKRCFLGLIF